MPGLIQSSKSATNLVSTDLQVIAGLLSCASLRKGAWSQNSRTRVVLWPKVLSTADTTYAISCPSLLKTCGQYAINEVAHGRE